MDDRDPTDLLAEEEANQARKDQAKAQTNQEADDYRWFMQSKRGRRIAYALLEKGGVYRTSFVGGTNETMFNEGQRNLALWFQAKLDEFTPEHFAQMILEKAK